MVVFFEPLEEAVGSEVYPNCFHLTIFQKHMLLSPGRFCELGSHLDMLASLVSQILSLDFLRNYMNVIVDMIEYYLGTNIDDSNPPHFCADSNACW